MAPGSFASGGAERIWAELAEMESVWAKVAVVKVAETESVWAEAVVSEVAGTEAV